MDNIRADELRTLAADISLGRPHSSYPDGATAGVAARPHASRANWIRYLRPAMLFFAFTPCLATLLLLWTDHPLTQPALALLELVGVVLVLMGAGLLDLYLDGDRVAQSPTTYRGSGYVPAHTLPRAVLVVAIALLTLGTLAMAPVALAGGIGGMIFGAIGLVFAVLYSVTRYALKWTVLGDLAIFAALGPGVVFITALAQHRPLSWPLLALGLAFGCFALTLPQARHLREMEADATLGRQTVALSLGANAARLLLAGGFIVGFASLALIALPKGAPHGVLLAFVGAPAAVVAIHGAYRAQGPGPRHLVVRATLHANIALGVSLLIGLALNALFLALTMIIGRVLNG